MQDVRLEGTVELKMTRAYQFEKSVCVLYLSMFSCFIMVNTLFPQFSFITKDSGFKMGSIEVLLQLAYVSLR